MVSEKSTKKIKAGFIQSAMFFLVVAGAFAFLPKVSAQGVLCVASAGALNGQPYITVNSDQDHVNVRGGPNSYLYDKVGILYPGESAPALGRTPGGDWIQIGCPGAPGGTGWVYFANVTLTSTGLLKIVELPPTPVFQLNLDPTLAASLEVQPTTTRLPTFTPPAPQQTVPVFTDSPRSSAYGWIAPLSFGLILAGLLGVLLSFLFRQ
jgi:hypothetical protein